MELKKSEKVDLQLKKPMFVQIGLIASLLLIYGMFNIPQNEIEIEIPEKAEEEVVVDLPPVTHQEEPVKERVQKVVAPSIADKIEIVENDIVVEESDMFNPETDEHTPNYSELPKGVPQDGDLILDDDTPVFKAEVDPLFLGKKTGPESTAEFNRWVTKRVKYPPIVEESGISGIVTVRFVIGKTGKIEDVEVVNSPDKLLSEEVIRVLKSAPAWSPGLQRDRPVPVRAVVSVKFQI